MSCNGCRVLRKGCSDTCILRSSLRWIESPEAQGHATVFVAKFFGRAGMMSFISAVPESQRPALFQSLLYEACGRTVNPVFGAVGLLWSGNWAVCQAAVETVLKGGTVEPGPCLSPLSSPKLPLHHLHTRRPAMTHQSSSSLVPPMFPNPSLKRSHHTEPSDISNKRSQCHLSIHQDVYQVSAGPNKDHLIHGLPSKQPVDPATKLTSDVITNAPKTKEMPYIVRELHAPVPQRLKTLAVNGVSAETTLRHDENIVTQGAMLTDGGDSGHGGNIELDLTLNSHAGNLNADHVKVVSSPSSFSPRSEGSSVTNAVVAEFLESYYWRTSSARQEERKLLHLLC